MASQIHAQCGPRRQNSEPKGRLSIAPSRPSSSASRRSENKRRQKPASITGCVVWMCHPPVCGVTRTSEAKWHATRGLLSSRRSAKAAAVFACDTDLRLQATRGQVAEPYFNRASISRAKSTRAVSYAAGEQTEDSPATLRPRRSEPRSAAN